MVYQSSSINNRPETVYYSSTNFTNFHAIRKSAGLIVKIALKKISQGASFLLKKSFLCMGVFYSWIFKPVFQSVLDVFLSVFGGVISKNRGVNALSRLAVQASSEE